MKKIFLALLLGVSMIISVSTPAQSQSSKTKSSTRGNADYITAAQLKDYLYFIASDEMEGRDTPSRGLNTAARFLATNLSRWGFKPAGDEGSYFQHIALRRNKVNPAQTHAEINGERFSFGNDFLAGQADGVVSGPLVYVSHGWVIKDKNIDAYQGIDVKDKIVVALSGRPKGVGFREFRGKKPGEDFDNPQSYAEKHGAKGIIIIPNFNTLAFWERQYQRAAEQGIVAVEKFQERGEDGLLPSITASPQMLAALFRGEKESAAMIFNRAAADDPVAPFDLRPNKKVSFTVGTTSEPETTQNVVVILEGSDRVLKNEYVAIGAHYDHVGIGRVVAGDSIYNGADDDGSGTVAVLAIAEAFARGPRPKRSMLFVWHAGEEQGLWGSKYLTEFPPAPLDQIVAQLNIDMIGRSKKAGDTNPENGELTGPNEIYVIGSKMMSTELGELSERVNKSFLKLAFNYKYDDPQDPNRFFFRSDHYNYAQKGIPIIFYFSGVHEDYHQASDSPDKIDYQKMEKVARTIYATAWELANAKKRPRVDKQLPAALTAN
jgi:hypothetical protein